VERFVILTPGRTGSELLVSLLDSHPQIVCDGELLATRRASPDLLIRSREALAHIRGARAYGFKLLRDHLLRQDVGDPARYISKLHQRGYRIILLERRDLLAQAVSFARAERVGYSQRRRDDGDSFTPMTLDPMAVLALMFVVEDITRFFEAALAGVPHIRLIYEDHLATPERQQAAVDELCRALGLGPKPVRTDLVRITPETIAEQLENHEELARVLSVTRYARYLPETLAPEPE
jgi:LPS sulfotransferase NodH